MSPLNHDVERAAREALRDPGEWQIVEFRGERWVIRATPLDRRSWLDHLISVVDLVAAFLAALIVALTVVYVAAKLFP